MEPIGYVLFAVAVVFYVRTWKYIHQLVKEVNQRQPELRFTTLGWWRHRYEPWRLHSRLFPSSSVRKQIAWNIAFTVAFMLGVVLVQVRSFTAAHP